MRLVILGFAITVVGFFIMVIGWKPLGTVTVLLVFGSMAVIGIVLMGIGAYQNRPKLPPPPDFRV